MGTSKVIVELEAKDALTPELKKSLENLKALSKETLDLKDNLELLRANKKGIVKGAVESDIKGVKELQSELLQLKSLYANAKGKERTSIDSNIKKKELEIENLLTREIIKQKRVIHEKNAAVKQEIKLSNQLRKGYDREKNSIDKTTKSREKENAVRRSTGNLVIRHIRQLESLVVGYYAVSSAIDIFVGQGIELNKKIEDSTAGIGALISANTQGISTTQKFIASMALSAKTVRDIKEASIETAATFPQLTETFQQAIGSALSAGDAMGASTQETIDNTIYMAKQMTNIASSIGMPMVQLNEEVRSLMEGTADQNSRIAKLIFGSARNANEQVREAKKIAGGLDALLRRVMEPFEQLGEQRTFSRLTARMTDAFDTLKIEATKPLFEDFKDQIEKTTLFVKSNTDKWIENYHNVYYQGTEAFSALANSFQTMRDSMKSASSDVFNLFSWLPTFQDMVTGVTMAFSVMGDGFKNGLLIIENATIGFKSLYSNIETLFTSFILNIKLLGKEIQLALYKAIDTLPFVDNSKFIKQTERSINILKALKKSNDFDHNEYIKQANEKVQKNREQIISLDKIIEKSLETSKATREIFAVGGESRDAFSSFSLNKDLSAKDVETVFTAYSNAYDELVAKYKGNSVAIQEINKNYTRNLQVIAQDYMAFEEGKLISKAKAIVADEKLQKKKLELQKEYFEKMGDFEEAWKIEKEIYQKTLQGLEKDQIEDMLKLHKIEYIDKLIKNSKKGAKEVIDIWGNVAKSMAKSFETNFFDLITGKFDNFKDFLKNAFKDIGKDALSPIAKQFSTSLFGGNVGSPLETVDVKSLIAKGFTKDTKTGNYIGSGEDEGVVIDSGGQVLQGVMRLAGQGVLSSQTPTLKAGVDAIGVAEQGVGLSDGVSFASGAYNIYKLATEGISASYASATAPILSGAEYLASGLQSVGLVSASAAAGIETFTAGVLHPFTDLSALAGQQGGSALVYGQALGGAIVGGVAGFAAGSIGDALLDQNTYADVGGAIGGAIGGGILAATALTNPIGWAALAAGVLIGGAFGRDEQMGSGYELKNASSANNTSGIIGYQDWQNDGGWFSGTKRWQKDTALTSSQKNIIDGLFYSYEYLLDSLRDGKDVIVQAGKYSGTELLDTALPKAFIQAFTSLSNIPATIGDSELDKVYNAWADYAKSFGKTVTEALTETVNGFITAQDNWKRTVAQINGDDILAYDINAQTKKVENQVAVYGSLLPKVDGLQTALDNLDFETFTELSDKAINGQSFSPEIINNIIAIGNELGKLASLKAQLAEQLEAEQKAEQDKLLAYKETISKNFNSLLNPDMLYIDGKEWVDIGKSSAWAFEVGAEGIKKAANEVKYNLINNPELDESKSILDSTTKFLNSANKSLQTFTANLKQLSETIAQDIISLNPSTTSRFKSINNVAYGLSNSSTENFATDAVGMRTAILKWQSDATNAKREYDAIFGKKLTIDDAVNNVILSAKNGGDIATALGDYRSVLDSQKSTLNLQTNLISNIANVVDGIYDFTKRLSIDESVSYLNASQRSDVAKTEYSTAVKALKTAITSGDEKEVGLQLGRVQEYAGSYLENLKQSTTASDYAYQFDKTIQELDALDTVANAQIISLETQDAQLKTSVDNADNNKKVKDAIERYFPELKLEQSKLNKLASDELGKLNSLINEKKFNPIVNVASPQVIVDVKVENGQVTQTQIKSVNPVYTPNKYAEFSYEEMYKLGVNSDNLNADLAARLSETSAVYGTDFKKDVDNWLDKYGYESGGYTPNVPTNKIAGAVHGKEWVAPAWMLNSPKHSKQIAKLESARTGKGDDRGEQLLYESTLTLKKMKNLLDKLDREGILTRAAS